MKFFHLALPVFLTLAVAACEPVPTTPKEPPGKPITLANSDKQAIQRDIRAGMKDPQSTQFGPMGAAVDSKGAITVCGMVNSKNSFGGYTGSQPYIGVYARETRRFALVEVGSDSTLTGAIMQLCQEAGVRF